MKRLLAALALFVAASSTSFAQFNWSNWSYPTGTTATASVGAGTVGLTLSGNNNAPFGTSDDPVQYQPNFPYTQTFGDSAGAVNLGATSFQMQLDFTGFTSTTGMFLAIGQLAHVRGTSGYMMSAFNALNQPIPISSFGQIGNFDFGTPLTGDLFNDDLSLANNGLFHVMTVAGQDNINSDMLILSLPAGVSKILVDLQVPTNPTGDTINFMVAPVPEASSVGLFLLGGAAVTLMALRRKRLTQA